MRISPEKAIEENRPRLPNRVLYSVIRFVARVVSFFDGAKFFYHFDKKEMRGKQVLLVSDHSSRCDYIYTFGGYRFARLNPVMGYHNAFTKALPLMLKMGFIFKRNLQVEVKPLKNIFSVVSKGGSIMLFPEGTQSVTGTNMPVLKSTVKLMKKLNLPVVLCKSYGAFFRSPDYNPKGIKGHQEFHYHVLKTNKMKV